MSATYYLLILSVLAVKCSSFRYDYTYSDTGGGWFKHHLVPATWNDARIKCSLEGAVLASPLNTNIASVMMKYLETAHDNDCGILTGVNARYSKGDFHSIEGLPLLRMPVKWMPYEPDNYNGNENCVIMSSNGSIADVSCSERFTYICYKQAPKGFLSGECGTIDKAYILMAQTSKCYKFHVVSRNWTNAYMTCLAEGGYLAVPKNDVDAGILKNLFIKNLGVAAATTKFKDVMLLGFLDEDRNGIWTTIHGQPLDSVYNKWANNQPDGLTNNQFCGGMFQSGLLDDIWCDKAAPFTCEKSPDSLLDKLNN